MYDALVHCTYTCMCNILTLFRLPIYMYRVEVLGSFLTVHVNAINFMHHVHTIFVEKIPHLPPKKHINKSSCICI